MTEVFEYTGDVQELDVSDAFIVEFDLHGSAGEDGSDGAAGDGGSRGIGGRLKGRFDVSDLDTVLMYVGGGNGNRWGFNKGGSGASENNSGGNGGGETSIRDGDDNLIAAADAGGGGAGGFTNESSPVGGGGGGAAGGSGGSGSLDGGSGDDAEGDGDGGDGGDGTAGSGDDGGTRYDSERLIEVVEEETGGSGSDSDGEIEATITGEDVSDATVAATTQESADIEWSLGEGADEHRIYRSTEPDPVGTGEQVGTVDGDVSTFTDTGLTSGRTYYWAVTAFNDESDIETDGSETEAATTVLVPTDVEASGSNARSVKLEWEVADDNEDGDITLFRSEEEHEGFEELETFDLTETEYVDEELGLVTTFFYYLERDTGDATVEGGVDSATTGIIPPEDVTVETEDWSALLDVEWNDTTDGEADFMVLVEKDGETLHESDQLEAETEAHTTPSILVKRETGDTVDVTVKSVIGEAEADSDPFTVELDRIVPDKSGYQIYLLTGNDEVSLDFESGDLTLRQTAHHNLTVNTGLSQQSLDKYADLNANVIVAYDGSPIFRGVLERAESQSGYQVGQTQVQALGEGWRLRHDESLKTYQNIPVFEALEDYLEDTGFFVTVEPDEGQEVGEEAVVQEASSTTDFEDQFGEQIGEEDPIRIEDDEIGNSQVCWLRDLGDTDDWSGGTAGEDFEGVGGPDGDDGATGGSGQTFTDSDDFVRLRSLRVWQEIPEEEVAIALRWGGVDGEDADVDIEIEVLDEDGTTVLGSVEADTLSGLVNFVWDFEGGFIDDWDDGNLQPGEYKLRVSGLESGNGSRVDLVGLFDRRYVDEDEFDNELHEEGGHLDGPPLYATVSVESEEVETEGGLLVSTATLETDFNDTTNDQAIAATNTGSFDENGLGSATFLEEQNTTEATFDFLDNDLFGTIYRTRLTFGPTDDGPRDATPRFNYDGQAASELTSTITTSSLPVIDEQELSDDHMTNVQNLCDQAGYTAVVLPHREREVVAFPTGSEQRDAHFDIVEANPDRDTREYANAIIVVGGTVDDEEDDEVGIGRYVGTAEDEDEIQRRIDAGLPERKARVSRVITDRRLESQRAVDQTAIQKLQKAVRNRLLTGSIEIAPTVVMPGVTYDVPELNPQEDDETQFDAEEVSFSIGHGTGNAQVNFAENESLVQDVSATRLSLSQIQQLL